MFLHIAWGGIYLDNENAAAKIHKCFSLAEEIIDSEDSIEVLTMTLHWLQDRKSENIEDNKRQAPKGVLKKPFSFKLFENWADEMYDAINEFYDEFSFYPNIISARPINKYLKLNYFCYILYVYSILGGIQ